MEEVVRVADAYFEPRLRQLGLGEEQLQSASADELQQSLRAVEDALTNVDAFDPLHLKIGINAGSPQAIIASPESEEATLKAGIGPILLARNRTILDRLDEIAGEQAKSALGAIAASPTGEVDEDTRRAAEQALSISKATEAADGRERARDPFAPYREGIAQVDLELRRARGKTQIRQSWFARENIAAIVGGVLLIVLAVTLIVAMFVGTEPSEVVTNAFLLILGYFFGQSMTRERSN